MQYVVFPSAKNKLVMNYFMRINFFDGVYSGQTKLATKTEVRWICQIHWTCMKLAREANDWNLQGNRKCGILEMK